MLIEEFIGHFEIKSETGGTYAAICPAHEDSDPSLHISQGDKGIVCHCKTGCTTEQIVTAIGLKLADLFDNPLPNVEGGKKIRDKGGLTVGNLARNKGFPIAYLEGWGLTNSTLDKDKGDYIIRWKEVRIPYHREDGSNARPRRRMSLDGKRKFCWGGTKDDAMAPYGLQNLQLARDLKALVLVEGESDVWSLHFHGYPVLGLPGAKCTGCLRASHIREINKVYIFQEPGEAGETFVAECKRKLMKFKKFKGEIFKMELSAWGDPSELHMEDGDNFRKHFDEAVSAAVPLLHGPASPDNVEKAEYTGLPLTDTGNAERLVRRHGDKLRFMGARGQWIVWDGKHWRLDNKSHQSYITDTTRTIAQEAAAVDDPDLADALRQHSRRSESASAIRSMEFIGARMLSVDPNEMDTYPFLFNCLNGILDLKTMELHDHDPAMMMQCLANVTYDPEATCPRWDQFVLEVMSGDQEMVDFLQRIFGYAMTGSTAEEVMFFFYGAGRNGKTKFLEVIREIMGSYSEVASMGTLIEDPLKRAGPSNDVAKLAHARYVTYSETSIGQHLNEGLIKSLTGGDVITARFLHREFFTFSPGFKLFMISNHKPRVKGGDDGIWSRILLIPFLKKFEGENQDKNILEALVKEKSGILNWMIKGCQKWLESGLQVADSCKKATLQYEYDSDLIGQFVESEIVQMPNCRETIADMYEIYRMWCEKTGENAFTKRNFNVRLEEKGFKKIIAGKNVRYWDGIAFKGKAELSDSEDGDLQYYWQKM